MDTEEFFGGLQRVPLGYRIHLERKYDGRWIPDIWPKGSDDPLWSRSEAERLLYERGQVASIKFKNFRVVEHFRPLRQFAGSIFLPYCRVSTDLQDPDCGRQKDGLTAFYKSTLEPQGVAWDGAFFVDSAISASIELRSRPAAFELFNRLSPGDHFAVHESGRAFRSIEQAMHTLDWLHQRRMVIHALDVAADLSSVSGRTFFMFKGVVDELERLIISQRTRESAGARKLRGLPVNQHTPHGKRRVAGSLGTRLATDVEELVLIRKFHEWHTVHGVTYRAISVWTWGKGRRIKRRNGTEWSSQSVQTAVLQFQGMLDRNDPELAKLPEDSVVFVDHQLPQPTKRGTLRTANRGDRGVQLDG